MAKFPEKLFSVLDGLDDESTCLIILNNITGFSTEEKSMIRSMILSKDPNIMHTICQFRLHRKPQFLVCSVRQLLYQHMSREQKTSSKEEDSFNISSAKEGLEVKNEFLENIKESTVISKESSKMISYDSNLLLFTMEPVKDRTNKGKSKQENDREMRLKETEERFKKLLLESKQYVKEFTSPKSIIGKVPPSGMFLSPRPFKPISQNVRAVLNPSCVENKPKKVIGLKPRKDIKKMAAQSFIRYVDLQTLLKALKRVSALHCGFISKSRFVKIVTQLASSVFKTKSTPREKMAAVFDFLAPDVSKEGVKFADLIAGLSLMCKGTEIEKISLAFHYLSQSYVGVGLEELTKYLSNTFKMLLGNSELEANKMGRQTAMQCFEACKVRGEDKIDAPAFYKWITENFYSSNLNLQRKPRTGTMPQSPADYTNHPRESARIIRRSSIKLDDKKENMFISPRADQIREYTKKSHYKRHKTPCVFNCLYS